jgi:hypothetical protein
MSETKFLLILTTDCELFGDGSGSVDLCMLDPTDELLEVAERYSCSVTLFLEMAELIAFKSSNSKWTEWGRRIEDQIVSALQRGHDVQLHFHPQWIGANIGADGTWQLHGDRCDLGFLTTNEQDIGRRADPNYQCIAFRAGGWAIRPEASILPILSGIGIRVDSSALPGMQLKNNERSYDFRDLPIDMPAWLVKNNLAQSVPQQGTLWEMPVFTRRVSLVQLLCSLVQRKITKHHGEGKKKGRTHMRSNRQGIYSSLRRLVEMITSPVLRLDYCVQNAFEMMKFVMAAKKRFANCGMSIVPLVMAGHTKTQGDLQHLDRFLEWAEGRIHFGTFGECLQLLSNKDSDNA